MSDSLALKQLPLRLRAHQPRRSGPRLQVWPLLQGAAVLGLPKAFSRMMVARRPFREASQLQALIFYAAAVTLADECFC